MPAPHQSTPGADDASSPVDFRQSIWQSLIGRGLNAEQARGVMMSLMGESGQSLDPKSYNPNDPGGAMGFAQWVGPRRAELQAVARQMGTSETDPSAQVAHFNNEINGKYKNIIEQIRTGAPNAVEAAKIWTAGFEAPKVNNYLQRVAANNGAVVVDADGNPAFKAAAPSKIADIAEANAAKTPASVVAAAPEATVGDYLKKGDVGGAVTALTKKDAQGNSPLDKALPQAPQKPAITLPELPQMPAMQDSSAAIAPGAQALMAQVMAQRAKPLTWSNRPYGYDAGPQAMGTTLNSTGG